VELNKDQSLTEIKKQANNIDERGNVLYLDEERLDRKVVGFPKRVNRKTGLGIRNLMANLTCMRKWSWPLSFKLYKIFIKGSEWIKGGGKKAELYKKFIMIGPDMETHTSTIVMPFDVDLKDAKVEEQAEYNKKIKSLDSDAKTIEANIELTETGEKVVVPMDLIKNALKHVDYIGGMDRCLCRDANDCEDYPHDIACLFFGDGGRAIVRHGLGKELTYEEACARVDKAAEHGLMGQAVWVEVEQFLWGIKNHEMDRFLEICFCCPCCCIAIRIARNATSKERHRFHPSGWTAVPDRVKCTGCRKCNSGPHGCPVEAISFGADGKVIINQEICVGCGICKNKCKEDVIKIKQTMPMRSDIHDYFMKDYNLDLKIWKED